MRERKIEQHNELSFLSQLVSLENPAFIEFCEVASRWKEVRLNNTKNSAFLLYKVLLCWRVPSYLFCEIATRWEDELLRKTTQHRDRECMRCLDFWPWLYMTPKLSYKFSSALHATKIRSQPSYYVYYVSPWRSRRMYCAINSCAEGGKKMYHP